MNGWKETLTAHAEKLPNGAWIVVLDVPALEDGEGCLGYTPEVAERLEALLAALREEAAPGGVVFRRFGGEA